MNAMEIGRLAYEANLGMIREEIKAGIDEGIPENHNMTMPWDKTPKFVKELYAQYIELVMSLPELMMPHEVQRFWIADQMSRGWKTGDEFSYETMTNMYLVDPRDWDTHTRNRFWIALASANSLRRFYIPEKMQYTETIQMNCDCQADRCRNYCRLHKQRQNEQREGN